MRLFSSGHELAHEHDSGLDGLCSFSETFQIGNEPETHIPFSLHGVVNGRNNELEAVGAAGLLVVVPVHL